MLTIIVKIRELYLKIKYVIHTCCYEVALEKVLECHKNDNIEDRAYWTGVALAHYYKKCKAEEKLHKGYGAY